MMRVMRVSAIGKFGYVVSHHGPTGAQMCVEQKGPAHPASHTQPPVTASHRPWPPQVAPRVQAAVQPPTAFWTVSGRKVKTKFQKSLTQMPGNPVWPK